MRTSTVPVAELREFNLSKGAELVTADRYHKVVEQIQRIHALQASHSDLSEAMDNLDAMRNVGELHSVEQPHVPWDSIKQTRVVVRALLKAAIIAYARAVDGGARGRVNAPLIEMIDKANLRPNHDRIIDVRNNAIAHYGIEEPFTSKWKDDAVMLVAEPSGYCSVGYAYSRANTRLGLIEDISQCVVLLLREIDIRTSSVESRLWLSLKSLSRSGHLAGILKAQGFDGIGPDYPGRREKMLASYATDLRRWEFLLLQELGGAFG